MLDAADSVDDSGGGGSSSGSYTAAAVAATAEAGSACGLALAGVGAVASAFAFAAVWSARLPRGGSGGALRLGLLSLSASDALASLCTAALLVTDQLLELPQTGGPDYESRSRRVWCAYRAVGWAFGVAFLANLLTLVFLAAQQFVAVRWPLRSADWLTAGRCRAAIAAVWLTGLALGFAPAVLVAAVTDAHPQVSVWADRGTTRLCYQLVLYHHRAGNPTSGRGGSGNSTPEVTTERRQNGGAGYTFNLGQSGQRLALVALDWAFACLALAALAISYGYIIVLLGRRRRARLSAECENGGSKAAVLADERKTSSSGVRLRERTRCVVVTLLVTLVCLVCYAPQFVYRLLRELETSCPSCLGGGGVVAPNLYYVVMAAACIAPVANPLIYTLRLKAVRDAAAALLARCCCGCCCGCCCYYCRTLAASLRAAGERHRRSGGSGGAPGAARAAAAAASRSSAGDSARTRSTDCANAVGPLAPRSSLESGSPTTDAGRPLLLTSSQEVQPTSDGERRAVAEDAARTYNDMRRLPAVAGRS